MSRWPVKQLKDICNLQNGFAFKSDDYISNSNTLNIRMSNIRPDGSFNPDHNIRYLPDNYVKDYSSFLLNDGDLIVAMTDMAGDPKILGLPTLVKNLQGRQFLLNQRVGKLFDFSDEIFIPYLRYYLSSPTVKSFYKSLGAGGLQINISKKDVLSVQIPVPSLQEQKHIVAILDQAFANIVQARATAETNLKNARELFDSYLQQVFTQHDNGWKTKKWGDICKFVRGPFGGSLKKSVFKESGYVVYEQKHAIHDHFNQLRYFIDENKFLEMKRFEVKPGEIIMSCSGVTLGRVAVIPQNIPKGIINQALLKLTPTEDVDVHFLKYWIRSKLFQDIIFKYAGGAAIPNVPSAKIMKEIELSLPSKVEQLKIVESIEQVKEGIEKVSSLYKQKLESLDELKKSILHKAFTGELTKSKGIAA